MGKKDPRVDAYIDNAADFAKPILKKLRKLVHQACPEVTESIKWGMPAFEYKGPFIGMAAFKQHCAIGFWKASLLFDDARGSSDCKSMTWGAPGRDPVPAKITSLSDLPADAKVVALIKKAMKLNDDGVKIPKEKTTKPVPEMPPEFATALKKSKAATVVFEKFPPSHKREYLEWILEAKRDETRLNRIAQAIEWISEGKQRNWKYQK